MTQAELSWRAAATANLLEARKKNGRLGQKKSRSGCLTCKARRIKCDEARPGCARCRTSGWRCEGYPKRLLRPKKDFSLLGSQPSHSLRLQDSDKRTFEYFLSWAAPRLSGPLDKDFWCGHVLQLAHAEPFVLDSLLAISIFYEHPKYRASFRIQHPPADDSDISALKYFNRAVKTVKKQIECGAASPLLALLSCLLFICVEVIRDDVLAALTLFTKGCEMMRQFESAIAREKKDGTLLRLIKLTFTRLGVLASPFGHSGPSETLPEAVLVAEHTSFADTCEARTALFALMADSQSFVQDANLWKAWMMRTDLDDDHDSGMHEAAVGAAFDTKAVLMNGGLKAVDDPVSDSGHAAALVSIFSLNNSNETSRISYKLSDEHGPKGYDIADLTQRELRIQRRLDHWYDAFQDVRKQVKDTETETISYLLMYYHTSTIWLSTRLHTNQTVFDDYTFHFWELIRHAEIFLRSKTTQAPTFTFEVGVIPPLYFTATKCRVPSIRRRALDLMVQAPGKECMWGASTTAELVSVLIAVEENGLGLPVPDTSGRSALALQAGGGDKLLPAEESRVHCLEILADRGSGLHAVRVTKYLPGGGVLRRRVEDFPV